MPQNDRNSRNRKRRRVYDQARDDRRGGQSTQRRSSAGAGSDPVSYTHLTLPTT